MIFIAHRGNFKGPKPELENKPDYVLNALSNGYYVEVDVWMINNELFLGHDFPKYPINIDFLQNKYLICHAKNAEALMFMIENEIHCFFHYKDEVVLTSKLWLWTYPGKQLTPYSIAVMPETVPEWNISECLGVCSDYADISALNSRCDL
jgi:hypothetical protein